MSDIKVSTSYTSTMDPTSPPVTPHHQIRSTSTNLLSPSSSAYSTSAMSDRSPADIKRKLEARLLDTKNKMHNIGKLGESLVKQERELNDRIKEMDMQSHEDEIRPELRSKLADLENGFKEIERESAKAFTKTIPFLGKENIGFKTPGDSPTKTEFSGHGTVSPSKNQSSRKVRNGTPRQHDIEFAADIGQGLLEEVRKLQSLLAQRDQKLNEATASITRLDRQIELFDRKVKQMHEDQESLKEENWNMHLRNQELQGLVNGATTDASKLATENTRLLAQNTSLTTVIESLKVKNAELTATLADTKTKHDMEMSALRRAQAGLQRDRSDLQRHVDDLKNELSKRPEQLLDNLDDHFESQDSDEREESVTPITRSPARSPQLSPIKNTPSRNAPLELETTKSSLHHAHRMVTNLRNNLHREKTEKLELKRLLSTAQDELETLRNKNGSKRAGKRPQLRRPMLDMLGPQRKSKHEISLHEDPQYLGVEWDEEGSTSAAYVTAREEESDAAFMTATEHEMSDTDAYRTGLESQPDSEDEGDLTETESGSSSRNPSMGVIREISPAIAFTSDEDDSPVRPILLKHRRSALRGEGRRVASSTFDPQPQPLFQELMEGGGDSVINSPVSVLDSPTSTLGTARALSPFFTRDVETVEMGVQCDPIPEPEPIVIQAPPVTVYKERERPESSETATQSDPIPDPEPIIIQAPPVTIYKEKERPASNEIGTQSDPIPDPEPIIIQAPPVTVYKERERPACIDAEAQSDPIPPPEPVIITPDPVIIHAEPVIVTKIVERERPACNEVGTQSDPIPPPEPVVIRPDPVIIQAEPVVITKVVERERPACNEVGIQSDPIPPPEPIIIRPDPVIIQAEPVVVTKVVERERPACAEMAVQSEPLPPPQSTIIYMQAEKPDVNHMAIQCEPVPDPEPIYIQSEPIVIYRDKELPEYMEVGVQSDESKPELRIVYLERDVPTSNEIGVQHEMFAPEVKEFGIQADSPAVAAKENVDKQIQTLLSIPLLEPFQFDRPTTAPLRPKTPLTLPSLSRPATASSKTGEIGSGTPTPRTIKTVPSVIDWDSTPKSPLKEITNNRFTQPGSPSRPTSLRHAYIDSPASISSRHGSVRKYGTILEHPTLHPSPRATMTRSRMSHPSSPTKRMVSPSQSRANMSVMSRSTTAMSRRTSLSSFESEVEDRFGLNREGIEPETQYATSTDPNVIQAITQTMIGEFLYKYTRNQMSKKISDKRHRRFFWIHPYTKTLYWSSDNPATSTESNRNTRSAPITKIRVVTDENPFPPGLFQKSIMCATHSREIKFTAPTKQSHETWLRALNHLLDRGPAMMEDTGGEGDLRPSTGTTELSMDMREFGATQTRRGSTHMASMSTVNIVDEGDVRPQSSFGRLSSMFRGDRGTMSTIKGKSPVRSIYEASMVTDNSRHSHEHNHDIDEDGEGLENVRACCGGTLSNLQWLMKGKHDVGTLSKKGGKHIHK